MNLVLSWWRLLKIVKFMTCFATYSQLDDPRKITWEAHVERWRVKCQAVFRESLCNLANPRVTRKTLCLNDFKCDSYTLHPYYIYPHYPQKCIEAIQKKTLDKFLQHTHFVRESYSSSKREILIVFSPPLSYCYTLRGDLNPNTTNTYSKYSECFGTWECIRYLPK